MRQKKTFRVLAFRTTHDALAMEAFCRGHNIPGRLIPTPQEVSAGCGLVWRMTPEDADRYMDRICEAGLEIQKTADVLLYCA